MDSAIAGLIGAFIGAFAGVGGALITHTLQARSEQKKWVRSKKEEAYSKSIRYLLRAANKRSGVTAEGQTFIGKDALKEWFDDLNEAQAWLTTLTIYCSEAEKPKIEDLAAKYSQHVSRFIGYDRDVNPDKKGLADIINSLHTSNLTGIYQSVIECARRDIGRDKE